MQFVGGQRGGFLKVVYGLQNYAFAFFADKCTKKIPAVSMGSEDPHRQKGIVC